MPDGSFPFTPTLREFPALFDAWRAVVPAAPENDEVFFSDSARLLEALATASLVPRDQQDERHVIGLLRACEAGYGCWLTTFEDALYAMDLTAFPDAGDDAKARLIHSLDMARAVLHHFHIAEPQPQPAR